jgi:hypothetical protein
MVLNIKNLFKKVCMLSAAATIAVGLGASFAEATPPNKGTTGTKLSDSVTINAATALTPTITLTNDTLTYDGNFKTLITAAYLSAETGSGAKLYLRAIKNGTTSDTKTWTMVWEEGNTALNSDDTRFDTENLQGKTAGQYDIYYYIDGNGNYADSSDASQ